MARTTQEPAYVHEFRTFVTNVVSLAADEEVISPFFMFGMINDCIGEIVDAHPEHADLQKQLGAIVEPIATAGRERYLAKYPDRG